MSYNLPNMFVIKRSIRKISPTINKFFKNRILKIEKLVPLGVYLSLDSATTIEK